MIDEISERKNFRDEIETDPVDRKEDIVRYFIIYLSKYISIFLYLYFL